MKVTRLFPRNVEEGSYMEHLAIFAARRCRTVKSIEDLRLEVGDYSLSHKKTFLNKVVNEDWALDVLEFPYLIFDIEDVPVWLMIEFLRHRLISRDFSFEQLSQRAMDPGRLKVDFPKGFEDQMANYLGWIEDWAKDEKIPNEILRSLYPQGVLVNFVVAANLRAWQHVFYMRMSEEEGGKGGAHPKFQELAGEFYRQAQEVYPLSLTEVLPA